MPFLEPILSHFETQIGQCSYCCSFVLLNHRVVLCAINSVGVEAFFFRKWCTVTFRIFPHVLTLVLELLILAIYYLSKHKIFIFPLISITECGKCEQLLFRVNRKFLTIWCLMSILVLSHRKINHIFPWFLWSFPHLFKEIQHYSYHLVITPCLW